jgi:hypothetical protein
VGRDIDVQNLPPPVLDDEPQVEQLEANGRDDEEVHCSDRVAVVSKEGHPVLPLVVVGPSFRQITRYGREADFEAELLEFGLDLPCSPVVLRGKATDQILQLR